MIVSGTYDKPIVLFPKDKSGQSLSFSSSDTLNIGYRSPGGQEKCWTGAYAEIDGVPGILYTLASGDIPVTDYGQAYFYGIINGIPSKAIPVFVARGISCST